MSHTYSEDLKMVKQAANIEDINIDFDEELSTMLLKSYNYMNIILSRYTTVPLSGTIPEIIKEIEADIAAGYFKEQKTVPVEGERTSIHILRKRGIETLNEYIKTTYTADSGATRAGKFRMGKTDRRLHIDGTDDDL